MTSVTFIDFFKKSNGYNVKVDNKKRQVAIYSKDDTIVSKIYFSKKTNHEIRVLDLFLNESNDPKESHKKYYVMTNKATGLNYLWYGGFEIDFDFDIP